MASRFSEGLAAGTGLRRQRFEEQVKIEEQKRARQDALTKSADEGIKNVLQQVSEMSKQFAERGTPETRKAYQDNIRSMLSAVKRTTQMATQSQLPISFNPEMLESIESNLLATPTAIEIAQTAGKARGTGLVQEAGTVSTEGGIPLEQAQQARGLRPKGPETIVNLDVSGSAFAKELGKEGAKEIFERRQIAKDAVQSLQIIDEAKKLVKEGMTTGSFANFRVGLGKTLRLMGFNQSSKDIDNAQAFGAIKAKEVANIIKAFGAGTGLSDADREYALKAAAGDIEMTEEAIIKVMEINERAYRNSINAFNKEVENIPKGTLPFDLRIESPKSSGQPKFLGFEQ